MPATTRQPGKTGHYKSRLYVGKGWYPSRAHTKRDDAAKKPNWPKPYGMRYSVRGASTVEPRLVGDTSKMLVALS
jgi:hypothetical protein